MVAKLGEVGFDVKSVCEVLEVSRSGYYAFRKDTPSARKREDERLKPIIKDTFFSQAQRSLMVYENLLRARYEESREKFGIDRLVKSQTYLAAFPLHDVSVTS